MEGIRNEKVPVFNSEIKHGKLDKKTLMDFIDKLVESDKKQREIEAESLYYIQEAVSSYEPLLYQEYDPENECRSITIVDVGWIEGFEAALVKIYKDKEKGDIVMDAVDICSGELYECIPLAFTKASQFANIVNFIQGCLIRNGGENEKQEGI